MQLSADTKFNYATLTEEKAASARAAAERIRGRMQLAAESIIEVGRELAEQQSSMGRGNFLSWIDSEFAMSQSAAYRFMDVHKRLGSELPTVGSLAPTALYALAAPSTPEPVRAEVLGRAANGEKVTAKEIEALKRKLAKAEEVARAAAETASLMEGRAQTVERELEGANLARLYAEQDKERFEVEVSEMRDEIDRLREDGTIHVLSHDPVSTFNDTFVAAPFEPTPWTDADAEFRVIQAVWKDTSAEARRRFVAWAELEYSASIAA